MPNFGSLPNLCALVYCLAAEWITRKRGNEARAQKLGARVQLHDAWIRYYEGHCRDTPERYW